MFIKINFKKQIFFLFEVKNKYKVSNYDNGRNRQKSE